jgi:hypothetical protein
LLATGTTLAGYRLDGVLGKGGMGVVYEATQLSLNRTVALKVLAPHLSDDPAFRARFRREGQIQAAIDHPNIVTVHEAGETEHGLFIAMRLVRGPTLKDLVVDHELDDARAFRILRPVADALDTAHEADLIHRDIKPQNVLVGARDHPYLADFGLTKSLGDTGLTRTGQFVGTLDYIAPEQARGLQVTGQCDVYSLTGVVFECLTGAVPYPRDSDVAVLYAHMTDPPPKVTEVRPELPEALDEVIARGMAKEPAHRYPTASAMLEAVEQALDSRVSAAVTAPSPIEVPEETVLGAEASPTVKAGVAPTVDRGLAPTVDAGVAPAEEVTPKAAPKGARGGGPPVRVIVTLAAVVAVAVVGLLLGHSGSGKGSAGGSQSAGKQSGLSTEYAGALRATILTLNGVVESGSRALHAASTPVAQATAATALGGVYSDAATALGKLHLSAADADPNGTLVAALQSTSTHYSAAARAARRGDRAKYNHAAAAIRGDQQATNQALAALKQRGYTVR